MRADKSNFSDKTTDTTAINAADAIVHATGTLMLLA
jgi:hypothetical protein